MVRSARTDELQEIAEILAAGLMRLRTPKSSEQSAHGGECSLAMSGHQSGHANLETPEKPA